MAYGRGSAQGPKKRSGRRSKVHGVDMHGARDAEGAVDPNTEGTQNSASQAGGAGTSIPSAGSSGKQAQMVFTIGTFDDDDDSYISDQLRNTAAVAATSRIVDAEAAGASHAQTRLLGARRSVELANAAHPATDARSVLDGRVDSSELPTSWKGAGLAKPAAAQRLQLKRQTLFTMGSHSEPSDIDGPDIYNGRLGRSAHVAHHSPTSSSVDSSDMADAVVTSSSRRDDHVVPESSAVQRVPGGDTVVNTDEPAVGTGAAAHGGETHAEGGCSARNSNSSSRSPAADHKAACNPNALHMCKASTSLSQLGKASDSSSPVDAAAATSSSASGQGSSTAGVPERVASAPAIQPAGDACGGGSCVSFAAYEGRDIAETSPLGKGKAPMPREGYAKPRKRVASKKPNLKKAVSTAALRARSRLGGPQRRDPLPLRAPMQLSTAAERDDGLADCSYVDYSSNSDAGEDRLQPPIEQQKHPDVIPQQGAPANVARADPTRASPHSSTATLDGASQDVEDSASTASIDSPRPEQSRAANSNQHPPNAAVASSGADAARRAGDTGGGSIRSRGGGQSPPPLRRDMRSRDHAVADLAQSFGSADMPPSSDSLAASAATDQLPSDQAARTVQRVQGGPPEPVVALSTKRNMESQRQQSMVEKEEEDFDIANSLLTGIPRRQNRPAGMAPYIYLNPSSPAYIQQVRAVDRTYGHVRATAHPMLESISRCVALREQRLAFAAPRGQARAWSSRRTPAESSEASLQAEWWESLMPPPPSNLASSRAAPGQSSRLQPAELPSWVLMPEDAKCAVYGSEFGQPDPSCIHVRELREHAKELKHARQHAVSAPRNQVLTLPRQPMLTTEAELETWRGRRVPGLLNVDIYSGAAGPLDPGARQGYRPAMEPRSSPSPEPMLRDNPLAPPYRRYGTVYGYTSAKAAGAWPGQAAGLSAAAPGGGGNGQGSAAPHVRGFDGVAAARPRTVGIWDNDPRRSSYFDRLSIDEARPQLASSAAQMTPTGFLRRVFSGLTGGGAAFGTSQ
ncbi:hypothetical protein GGH95_000271 [Coemansia sp. RSA 1836]|nr:hypothetical protein GGH95_000271 [Coemansia sp. RSA 1836]